MNKNGIALAAKDLHVSLSGRPIVRGVDAQFPLEAMIGILGPNGAAKTTLLRALCGFLPPQKGEIRLFDRPLSAFSRKEKAKRIAYVPQHAEPDFDFTLHELVRMGRYPHLSAMHTCKAGDREQVLSALSKTGLSGFENRAVRTLSGGEWQRALIARALCQQADCLLLDEPTAALDIAHQNSILRLLRGLSGEGKLILLVLHDINLAAAYCDLVLLMQNGQSAAFGPPEEVLTPDLLSQVYHCSVHMVRDEETGRRLYYGL